MGKMICKNRKQLAEEYGIDPRTLIRLLREKGIDIKGKTITPADLKKVYNALGVPGDL